MRDEARNYELAVAVGACVEIKQLVRLLLRDLREPPLHRADAITATTSRRWPENSTPSSRRSYGDSIAS